LHETWREVEISAVAELNPESVSKKSPLDEICYLDIGAVSSDGIDPAAVRTLKYSEAPSRAQRIIRAGDVIISTVRPYLRARDLVGQPFDGFVASTGFCVVRPGPDILPGYLAAVTSTDKFYEHLESRQTGALYPAVRPGDIAEARIALPPLEEQQRIADFANSIGVVRERLTAHLIASRALAANLRAEAFKGHDTVRLADRVTVTMGRQRSPKHQTGKHIIPYLRAGNVKDGVLKLDDVLSMNFSPVEQQKYALQDGDVVVTEGCGSLEQIGASARWSGEITGAVGFQNTLLRLRALPGLSDPEFVYQWARWAFESGRFAATAAGTHIFHIGAERAVEMTFPDLEIDEQKKIALQLQAADSVSDAMEEERRVLKAFHSSLLHALVSGSLKLDAGYDRFLSESESVSEPDLVTA